jgi:membrane protease YdiL (CAAX protease family)
VATTERTSWAIERADGPDFPFYNGVPVALEGWRWLLILSACTVGLLALVLSPQPSNAAALFPRVLFPFISLAVFIALSKGGWRHLFVRPRRRDLIAMVAFALLTLAVSAMVGWIVLSRVGAAWSPVAVTRPHGVAEWVTFYLGTAAQLFGEELFTILPFLACLCLLCGTLRVHRGAAVVVSWLASAALFGAAHLPAYAGNLLQALVVIGAARLVLTLAFVRTKNILVSTGAHILSDWTGFTLVLVITR